MKKGLVTITMSAYNCASTIGTAIESLLAQTYTCWELIIIDDASRDNTFEIIKYYTKQDNRIRGFRNKINRGTYWNRNRAILFGQGEFITNLDADDAFYPNKLAVQIEKIGDNAACICYHRRGDRCNQIAVGSNTLLFKRTIISTIGYFDSIRYDADTEHFKRIGACFPIIQIPDVLYHYAITEGSLTETEETSVNNKKGRSKRQKYQQNYLNWHRSDTFPHLNFPIVKRPFPIGHESQACPQEDIIVSLATFPDRQDSLKKMLASIYPWVNRINVFLNEYTEVPEFLKDPKIHTQLDTVDWGDTGKFFWADKVKGYHFICDDDLEYSRQYFELLLTNIEKYNREAIISLHGSMLSKKEKVDYYSDVDRTKFTFRHSMKTDKQVDFIGTGVMAYHTDKIKVSSDIFKEINMADVFLGIYAQKNNIPLIRCASTTNLIKDCGPKVQELSIYKHCMENRPTKLNKRASVNNYLQQVQWSNL